MGSRVGTLDIVPDDRVDKGGSRGTAESTTNGVSVVSLEGTVQISGGGVGVGDGSAESAGCVTLEGAIGVVGRGRKAVIDSSS